MRIRFAAAQPEGDHALALPIRKGADFPTNLPGLDAAGAALARAAAAAARFEGEVGATAELVVADGQGARRIVLFGLGDRDDAVAWEKAGGALAARLLTSGETRLVVDLSGSVPRATDAAGLALGATLRSWRHDIYRTRLPEKSKPTLDEIVIVGAADGAEDAWAERNAVAEGVVLTRTLVSEPANIIYPESFVERCAASGRTRHRDRSARSRRDGTARHGGAARRLAGIGTRAAAARDALGRHQWCGEDARRLRRQGRDVRYRRHLASSRLRAWKT
jgi:leucyl aminopeptidase